MVRPQQHVVLPMIHAHGPYHLLRHGDGQFNDYVSSIKSTRNHFIRCEQDRFLACQRCVLLICIQHMLRMHRDRVPLPLLSQSSRELMWLKKVGSVRSRRRSVHPRTRRCSQHWGYWCSSLLLVCLPCSHRHHARPCNA